MADKTPKGEPMSKDEQMQALGDLVKSGDLLFAAAACTNGEAVAVVNALYEHPGSIGVVLADMVGHIVGAYVEAGYDPMKAKAAVLEALGEELDFPTCTPTSIEEMKGVIPEA